MYDPAKTEEFMGVPPSSVADLLALKGDSIDNIPGAPGIGDKGARDLIVKFGSVENALDRAAEVERKMYRESLQNHRDQILLSKKLATIDTQTPGRMVPRIADCPGTGHPSAEGDLPGVGIFQRTSRSWAQRSRPTTKTIAAS